MKKLSKILVVVLTLAMLLGVIVISASASDKAVDLLNADGEVISSYDTLTDAVNEANATTAEGDITVRLNADATITAAITITRDSDLGKVIIDLNGKKINASTVANTYTTIGNVVNSSSGAGRVVDYVFVKADAEQEDALPYLLETISFDGEIKDLEGNTVLAADLVPGETYIGTLTVVEAESKVSKNHKLPTLTFKRGVFNVAAGASLEIAGNGGTITRGHNAHVFYIDEDADGAELYVRDLQIPGSATAYVVYVNNGVATFDNVYMYSINAPGIIRHANSAELNIKNSYLYMPTPGGANGSLIKTQGTNFAKDNPADGYHIEVKNTTIITAAYAFASAHTDVSACASAFEHVQPDGTSKTRKTFYAAHEVPLVGNDYVNTNFLVENCNIEVVNYTSDAAGNDRTALIGYSGFMNFDFKKSNLLVSQRGIYYGLATTPDACYINFYDCYFELTAKGNLNTQTEPAFVYAANGLEVGFYNTELAIGKGYTEGGSLKTAGTTISVGTYLANYAKMSFYAGCIFDAACTPDTDAIKARVVGNLVYNNEGKAAVTGIDFTGTSLAGNIYIGEFLADSLDKTTTSGALNPIVALSGGGTKTSGLTEAGADATARITYSSPIGGKGWIFYSAQGIERVGVEADGNQYVYWDPSYVKNDMTGYTYVAAADFATAFTETAVILPGGVTAVGGWDIDADGVLEYLDTDDNTADAEYVNIDRNTGAYSWVVVPDAYTSNVATASSPWYTIGSKYFYAPEYQYITYSFDYKNADGSDYFLPLSFNVQGRAEFTGAKSSDSGNRAFELNEEGKVYISNVDTGAALEKDAWNNITLIVELKTKEVAAGTGIMTDKNTWSNISYNPSVIHVFINGEKAGTFASNFANEHGYVATLRGTLTNSVLRQSDIDKAIAGGAKMCIDNVRDVGYKKGYESAELSALLAGTETNLDTWSESIFALHSDREVTSFPVKNNPVASVTLTPPVRSEGWTSVTSNTTHREDKASSTTFTFDNIADAIANAGGAAKLTVELCGSDEKVFVDAPATVVTKGYEFTYYSSEYKAVVEEGTITFVRATDSELVEVSYGYADEVITETFVNGGYFWLDITKIPKNLKYFDAENAKDMQLAYNGNILTAINPEDYAAGQIVSAENNSFIFSYIEVKQYGWIILDVAGQFSGLSVDAGDDYAQLVARINVIEKFLDPMANDNDEAKKNVADIVDGKINPALYTLDANTEKLRTNGYTIKFFKDFENVETLAIVSSTVAKTVTYDLNGHTISYADRGIFAYGAKQIWIYEKATNNVVQVHGSYLSSANLPTNGNNSKAFDWYNTDDYGIVVVQNNKTLNVNIISSKPGAKMISTSSNALVSLDRQEHIRFKDGAGATVKPCEGYTSPTVTFGNAVAASHTGIGPDANVINVEAKLAFHVYQFNSGADNIVQNLNIVSDNTSSMIVATNDRTVVRNCNLTNTNANCKGVLGASGSPYTGTIKLEITKCNIIALYKANLFDCIGGRYDSTSSISVSNTRMYNVAIDSRLAPQWSGNASYTDTLDEVITIGADCYYTVPFNPTKTYSLKTDGTTVVEVVPFRLAASRAQDAEQYQANVIANETFTINGVEYTFTYKVVADDDVVDVSWQSPDGSVVIANEKYVSGAKLVYNKAAVVYDAITKTVYTFENLGTAILGEDEEVLVIKADELKYIPSFNVETTVVLQTNLKHIIKIYRYVYDAENDEYIDITDYITDASVGGAEFALSEANLEAGDAEKYDDDFYYFVVDVKSNAIAGTYDLVINFNTILDTKAVVSTQTLSVAKYLAGELVDAEGELYDILTAVVNYGIAAYNYFADTAVGNVDELVALADKYPMTAVENEIRDAGAAGDNLDVEFVLDDKLEYRFYIVGFAPEYMNMSNVFITYTNIDGETKTVSTVKGALKIETDGKNYWVDFEIPAYESAFDLTVRLYNNMAGVDYTATYSIANYYADAQAAGASEALISLAEALYAYATYAYAYAAN